MSGNMKVTVNRGNDLWNFELSATDTVEFLASLVCVEMKQSDVSKVDLFLDGAYLATPQHSLAQAGIKHGSVLQAGLHARSLQRIPMAVVRKAAAFIAYVNQTPVLLQQLLSQNPTLAEAVLSENAELCGTIIAQQNAHRNRMEQERKRKEEEEIRRLQANPFDPESQARIAEIIRQQNIQKNMEHAMEYNPESFTRVVMLYVPMEINKQKMKVFVDTGAQMTIMSKRCAELCNISYLIDTRFSGMAKGVGTAKILGKIHSVSVNIGGEFFTCSFTILDNPDGATECIFGLDQMRKHQAVVDLKDNVLRIGKAAVPFLAEKDLPQYAKENDGGESKSDKKQPTSHSGSKHSRDGAIIPNSGSSTTTGASSGSNNTTSGSTASSSASGVIPGSSASSDSGTSGAGAGTSGDGAGTSGAGVGTGGASSGASSGRGGGGSGTASAGGSGGGPVSGGARNGISTPSSSSSSTAPGSAQGSAGGGTAPNPLLFGLGGLSRSDFNALASQLAGGVLRTLAQQNQNQNQGNQNQGN